MVFKLVSYFRVVLIGVGVVLIGFYCGLSHFTTAPKIGDHCTFLSAEGFCVKKTSPEA